ncbi:MAG: hypothetical protein KC777_09900 [Cyanobacteria bacterium HKST-UBA02]|nr:hypothetical protein [Cyanobacteria bacterium HKST-UBA02]
MIRTKTVAYRKIEAVTLVDATLIGKYIAVQLKNDKSEYRVFVPEEKRALILDKLEKYDIKRAFRWECN